MAQIKTKSAHRCGQTVTTKYGNISFDGNGIATVDDSIVDELMATYGNMFTIVSDQAPAMTVVRGNADAGETTQDPEPEANDSGEKSDETDQTGASEDKVTFDDGDHKSIYTVAELMDMSKSDLVEIASTAENCPPNISRMNKDDIAKFIMSVSEQG